MLASQGLLHDYPSLNTVAADVLDARFGSNLVVPIAMALWVGDGLGFTELPFWLRTVLETFSGYRVKDLIRRINLSILIFLGGAVQISVIMLFLVSLDNYFGLQYHSLISGLLVVYWLTGIVGIICVPIL